MSAPAAKIFGPPQSTTRADVVALAASRNAVLQLDAHGWSIALAGGRSRRTDADAVVDLEPDELPMMAGAYRPRAAMTRPESRVGSATMERVGTDDVARVARTPGAEPVAWQPATRGGQTAASRWRVTLPEGGSAFVKLGATLETAAWIRDEHLAYARLRGATFLPRMLGFHDDGERPALAIEDLGAARWPPPWDGSAVAAVLACSRRSMTPSPAPDLPSAATHQARFARAWREVADAPAAFLALGLCGPQWLERALPDLDAAARQATPERDRPPALGRAERQPVPARRPRAARGLELGLRGRSSMGPRVLASEP